ncbi:DinB family protein [Flavihumibacter solisilvae]|uniref:DinB-like domain-containing protein n=1 Tax=Flavihumibacter solisilvae TaxID=1349421 RepID=A0A0C1L056_9BACT|nr:DinB family protein [Flavihumibacter solisilvae]KIC92926.1 hypothetical protein OI18_20165 [Flavihumibacter solisilvae]
MKDLEIKSINLILNAWYQQLSIATELFDSLDDDQLLQPIAPQRNTGKYLLGHLTAVHDAILPLLDMGDRMYPLLEVFVREPEGADTTEPSIAVLRNCWTEVNARLKSKFAELEPADWFARHLAVSEEDFVKAPHRNKLNVVLNRMNHLSYHLGQLVLVKPKA